MPSKYIYEHGSYYLYDFKDGERIGGPRNMVDQLAIAFVDHGDMIVMHKHGSPEDVEAWVRKKREELPPSLDSWAQGLGMVSFDKGQEAADHVNRAIANSCYLEELVRGLS